MDFTLSSKITSKKYGCKCITRFKFNESKSHRHAINRYAYTKHEKIPKNKNCIIKFKFKAQKSSS